MGKPSRSCGRWRSGAAGGALAAFLGVLFLSYPLGHRLADLSFELPFRVRPHQPAEGVRIIYMDRPSTEELEQPWDDGAWDRKFHAQLLSRLKEAGAKAVVFDILWDRPGTNDQALLDAIQAARQAGTIVVVGGEVEITLQAGRWLATNVVRPFPALAEAASWGLAERGSDTVARRRHFPGAEGEPSLAWRVAELTVPDLQRDLPAERWINYCGPPGYLSNYSYYQALDTNLTPASLFAGQVCFVGARPTTPFAGGVRTDEWATPYGSKSPGVELTATVYLNLAHRQWLNRLSALGESAVVVLTGLMFGFSLAWLRPGLAVGAGPVVALAVAAAACWGMWQWQTWFSWLVVAGVQIPAGIAWSVLAYTRRIAGEKALLEKRLATATGAPDRAPVKADLEATRRVAPPAGPEQGLAATAWAEEWIPSIPDHAMVRQVGRGAYGEVWLARNAIGTYHVVKIVRREDFREAGPYEREFRGLQKFMPISRSHPGFVQILHVGRHDQAGFIYYIMEAADDENSGQEINPDSYAPKNLAKEIRKRGHFPAAECVQLALDLTAALEFLHQRQLIHRDVKPANIIFVNGTPKFADVGLVTDIATPGRDVTWLGTTGYLAPEGPGTPAGDVYSLGKVLYEASTGLPCDRFPELPPDLLQRPDHQALLALNKVVLKASRQELTQRYPTAAAMRHDLLRLQIKGSPSKDERNRRGPGQRS